MSELDLPIKINEIFYSIQGESSLAGWPTVFVRTSGCNIRCTYCDTKYSYFEGEKSTLDEVLSQVKKYSAKYVCVTGGEPMAQTHILTLLKLLCDEGYIVSLETNGYYETSLVDPRVIRVIDVKTPASGEVDSFNMSNLKGLKPEDQIKFVICNENDYEWSKNFVREHQLVDKCSVFFSPAFSEMPSQVLAEKILKDSLPVRLQLQLHKYIWNPHTRGV